MQDLVSAAIGTFRLRPRKVVVGALTQPFPFDLPVNR
jgi:hypothetical protein